MKEEHSLMVIGAGWGRTGTTSLKAALEQLGYPCYHMSECVERDHSDFWNDIANEKCKDFNEVFCDDDVKFTAAMDFPASLFWRELLQRYPEAKVILTVRDPESWYRSYESTILTVMPSSRQLPFVTKVGYMMCFPNQSFISMLRSVYETKAFQGSMHKEHLISCYNAHNEAVIKDCPSERLLVFNVKMGWEPLCTFLQQPVPTQPFPHMNDSKTFQNTVRKHVLRVVISQLLIIVTLLVPVMSLYVLVTKK